MSAGRPAILVARSVDRAAGLAERLRPLGIDVVIAPVTATAPPERADALDAAVHELGSFDWVAVTSVNGAQALVDAAHRSGVDLPDAPTRWAAVGPATAAALQAAGLTVHLEATGTAAALVDVFPDPPGRVLLPLGDLASGTLERGLSARDWVVHRVVAYRTVPVPLPADVVAAARERRLDLAVVAAGSAARELANQFGPDAPPVVAIGEPSAAAARAAGLEVRATAVEPTDDGLAASVTAALALAPVPGWNPGPDTASEKEQA